MKANIASAIIFMALGVLAGYVSTIITAPLPWQNTVFIHGVTIVILFGLMVFLGKAVRSFVNLLLFTIMGYVSTTLSWFLGQMWGWFGGLVGTLTTFMLFFILLLMLGTERTGVKTT